MVNNRNIKKLVKTGVEAGTAGAIIYGGYKYLSSKTGDSSNSSSSNKNIPSNDTGATAEESSSTGSSSSSSGSDSDGSGESEYETKVVEVPITTYKEAMEFANREWNKIKRDNGRQLDVKVLGSCNWKCGEWCKVYLPSFDIDEFMYIIRTSQSSDGGDWTTNLSLVDYPPGWGKEELPEDTSSDEEEDSESEDNSEEDNSSE